MGRNDMTEQRGRYAGMPHLTQRSGSISIVEAARCCCSDVARMTRSRIVGRGRKCASDGPSSVTEGDVYHVALRRV